MQDVDPSVGLQKLANSSFNYQMDNIFTCLPGIVLAVRDDLEQMAIDVQPTLNIKRRDGVVKERPAIMNVPLHFPASSTSAFTFPVHVGDTVMLVFSMRGLDTWKRGNGYPSTPVDFRKFDKRDCFAFPGFFPLSESINDPAKRHWTHNTNDTVIVHNIGEFNETEVRLLAGGGVVINTNQDVEANCNNATINSNASITMNCVDFSLDASNSITITSPATTWIGGINQTGDYTLTGNLIQTGTYTLNSVNINMHIHSDVQPGIGVSGGMV